MTPDGYVEGFRSLAADEVPMVFQGHRSNAQALAEAQDIPAARRLAWFNHGFMRAHVAHGALVLSDFRLGSEPAYFFRHAVDRRARDAQQAVCHPTKLDPHRDSKTVDKG